MKHVANLELIKSSFDISKLFFWGLVLVAISLPWPMVFGNYAIGLLGIIWVFTGDFKRKWQLFQQNMFFILCSSIVFILSVYGLLFTDDTKEGLFLLEKRLPIVILPIIVLSYPALTRNEVAKVGRFFSVSCFVAMVFCICEASRQFMALYLHGYINHSIFTSGLLNVLEISHVYFGLFLVFVFLMLTNEYFSNQKTNKNTLIYIFLSLFIFLFLTLITAKMAMITSAVLFGIYIVSTQDRAKSFKYIALFGSLIFALFLLLMYLNVNVSSRLQELSTLATSEIENNDRNYASTRLGPWKCSMELIKSYGLIGLGTGDTQNSMNNWYRTHALSNLLDYESHNQYLNILLSFGLAGISMFCFCALNSLRLAISKHYPLYLFFLLGIYLCCITENIFDSNKGIIFFALFNSLFLSSINLENGS